MNTQIKNILPFLLFPLAVGAFAALLTTGSMEAYADLCQPAPFPAGMGVSGGVDHSLSADGIRRLPGGKFWEMHQQCFVFLHFAAVF